MIRKKKQLLLSLTFFILLFGFAGITLIREHILPIFYLDLNTYSSSFSSTVSIQPDFAKKLVHTEPLEISYCHVHCTPQGILCDAVKTALPCFAKPVNHRDFDFGLFNDDKKPTKSTIEVQVDFTFGKTPFCYIPFYKTAEVPFEVKLSFSRFFEQELPGVTMKGNLNLTTKGIIACYDYKKLFGKLAAQEMLQKKVDALLRTKKEQ